MFGSYAGATHERRVEHVVGDVITADRDDVIGRNARNNNRKSSRRSRSGDVISNHLQPSSDLRGYGGIAQLESIESNLRAIARDVTSLRTDISGLNEEVSVTKTS